MAEADFDIEGLARYLHITPQQVDRLASRGQVPGRRVAGKWRFSQAEIHHWMEERMGLLEDLELVHVEGALARADNLPEDYVTLASMLHLPSIEVELKGRTKNSVINEMTQLAAASGVLWDPRKWPMQSAHAKPCSPRPWTAASRFCILDARCPRFSASPCWRSAFHPRVFRSAAARA